jgi:hypothetical protein
MANIEVVIKKNCYYNLLSKNENFDQKYLNTGSKTQNVEELGLCRSDIP